MPRTITGRPEAGQIEIGAAFTTAECNLAAGDQVVFSNDDGDTESGEVLAADGDLIILQIAEAKFECRRGTNNGVAVVKGAAQTSWVVYGLLNHTTP